MQGNSQNILDLLSNLSGLCALASYPQLHCSFDVTKALVMRPIWTHYHESALEFLQRALAAEGLNCRFEHDQGQLKKLWKLS